MHPSILFLDVEEADRPMVRDHFPAVTFAEGDVSEEQLVDTCKDAVVISCFITTSFPHAVIERLPALKLLCTRSVGFDHIDIDACKERGIVVCNVPDYGSHVIAEHVFALLLSTLRHIQKGNERVESGVFDYRGLRGMALEGKTIGIVGTGKIGRKVAKIAHGYDMRILATDQCRTMELETELGARYVTFEELIRQSDIVSLHLPATKETHHLFDATVFAQMKDGVVIVNTARGTLIDSPSLLAALDAGKVAYALLDVLEDEHDFEKNEALIKHPKVVVTPHIAFYADDSMRNMYQDAIQSIEQWMDGKQPDHIAHALKVICDLPKVQK